LSDLEQPAPALGGWSSPRRRRLRLATALAVLVGSFAYLFAARVPWNDFVATAAAFDWRLAPRILALQLVFIALGGLALWLLVGGRRRVALRALLAAYWRCVAVGFWTPAALGELSLAWWLRPNGLPVREGLALMTIDKLVTVVALGICALPMLARLSPPVADPGRHTPLLWAALGAVAVAGILLIALQLGRWRRRASRALTAALAYARSLRAIALDSPARLVGNLGLTLLRVGLGTAVLGWSMAAFDSAHSAGLAELLMVSSAARLLAFALPAPNGLGIYEVTLVEFLSPGKVPAPAVLSGVLLSRVIGLVAIGCGLLVVRFPAAPPREPSEEALGPR
jgi:uncharacterized membrane protein YbhN (UPF0104 family)